MVILRILTLVLGGLLACGRSESANSAPPVTDPAMVRAHHAVGCWQVAALDYQGYATIPSYLRLFPELRDGPERAGRAHLDASATGPGLGLASWLPRHHSDTIDIWWGDGLSGVRVALVGTSNTLTGSPNSWTDLNVEGWTSGRLTLTRIGCSDLDFDTRWEHIRDSLRVRGAGS